MTAQFPEVLFMEGKKVSMTFCPPIPENHPRIRRLSKREAADIDPMLLSTACWRNYVGVWEIKDERLYLKGVYGVYKLEGEEPLFADWFTGVLRVPLGGLIQYVHMGFGSVYEGELHIKIENGVVMRSRTIDNRGKHLNAWELGENNLPGKENRFPGDDEL